MRKRILACLSTVALCLPAASHAVLPVYEYKYTGNTYTSVTGTQYTQEMRISGTMILEAPLAVNIPLLSDGIRADQEGVPSQFVSPLSFSFFDGLVTVTKDNSMPLATRPADVNEAFDITTILVSTDSAGEITEWYLFFKLKDPESVGTPQIFVSHQVPKSMIQSDRATLGTDFASINNLAGTWSVSAVPEPSSYALMLAGIGLVGYAACRRRRG